jgi:methylthioxylose transferase
VAPPAFAGAGVIAQAPAARRRLPAAALAPAVCFGAVAVAAVGIAITETGGHLGTWTAPFVMRWYPRVDRDLLITATVFAGALKVAPALVRRAREGLAFALGSYALALALGLSLNLARDGDRGWWAMFALHLRGAYEGRFEYLPGLPLLDGGIGHFLRDFPALLHHASTHVKGNPPGPLILMHLLGIHTAGQLAALCIGAGSLCAPLAYDLGRTLGGERRGRIAAVLASFTPSMLLFGVSSFDYVFAAFAIAAVALLVRRDPRALAAGAAIAALGSFCSWLLLAIPAYVALLVWQRDGRRRAVQVALAAAAAVVALNGGLWLAAGYDPLAALRATDSFYRHGAAAMRPYAFWVVGSPAAWALMLGLPLAWCSLRAAERGDEGARALWLLIALAAVIGLTKAETERIWLPFAPLACVAAAAAVPAGRLRPMLLLLACQAIVVELLFFTVW